MKNMIKAFIKEENGAATILEYTIILPLVMAIVFILIFTGHIQHQKAVLQAATERGTTLACRLIIDPNYKDIVTLDANNDKNDIDKIHKNDPYRYLFRKSENMDEVEKYVRNIAISNTLFGENTIEVTAKSEAGIINKVTVSAKQNYKVPVVLPAFELPDIVTIEAESMAYVNQPAEFIRNADFALQLVKPLVDNISGAITSKVNGLFEKIKYFKDKVK